LHEELEKYLAIRRALGYKLRWPGQNLRRFVEFAKRERAGYITTELAMKWATMSSHTTRTQWATRLRIVRNFATYCRANDPRNEVPPLDLLPYNYRRVAPHLYSNQEIRSLIKAARQLPSEVGLRPHTVATLIGLYVATGLRANEALHLRCDDVDLTNGVLTIRGSKFGKSRHVPVHASTRLALKRYATLRDRLLRGLGSPFFFLSDQGTPVKYMTLRDTFLKLSYQIGLRAPGDSRGPGLHGFRHRLAIQTLLRWYRSGVNVEQRMPQLATYLGHVKITHTQWYLTGTPQLLRYALDRVESSESKRMVRS
jgi:integrase